MTTSRREVLRGLAAGAALATIGGRAAAVTNEGPLVFGSGEHSYELVRGWWKPPPSLGIGYTHAIVEDSQGRIIVHNMGKDAVAFFDADGRFIKSWGESLATGAHPASCTRSSRPRSTALRRRRVWPSWIHLSGNFRYPAGVRIRGNDLVVPDLLGRVTILVGDDQLVTHIGLKSEGKWERPEGFPDLPKEKRVEGELIAPHDVCWDHDGNLYVVEWVPDGRVSKWRRVRA